MSRDDFEDLVRQLARKLYGFAFRILHNKEEAEDAVQEVFIKLWKMNEKLHEYQSLEALATTMTKNYCIDLIRKHKHIVVDDQFIQDQMITNTATPYEAVVRKETESVLRRIISQLPVNFRELITLKEIDGLSYEEMAVKTGQNINTLRVNIARARKLVRDEFNLFQYERRGSEKTD
jgi:RNA polymerase sigma-70 factor (ECF subfamily)